MQAPIIVEEPGIPVVHSSWAHDRDNMRNRVRRLFARRIMVAYIANCAHSFGLLLLASTLHTWPHTLACCAFSCIGEWQTSHWQKGLKGCQQAVKVNATSHWAATPAPARLRRYASDPTMLEDPHGTKGRETRRTA